MPLPLPNKNSSIRPGVPMTISEPWNRNLLMSSAGEVSEDTRSRAGGNSGGGRSSELKEGEAVRVGCAERNCVTTECIWVASSLSYKRKCVRSGKVSVAEVAASADLVGLIMSAPIWFGPSLRSLRMSFSRIGITKASVFPEPVTASTTTSLCCMNNGIVAAWTGVIWVWPIASMTSRLHRRREIQSS